ncbi:hypothetical protein RF11_03375 [Thelohanellus kitauei]|uniref:Uncharacterized protein n=1 Tax=Thelohanellus kitauei TaxID=669202 RepID=A0A0C2J1D1_THEKT|nr:hypothetical protein RF11_03375 [Thelohanellus kitauei]
MSTIGSNTGENKESDESDKDENEKDILSICFNPSTFAAAIYDQKASKIVLMCDKNSIRRGNCLIKLISQIDPTFLLIRETQFDLIFEHLKDWKIDESVFLKRLPNSFYDVKAAKNKIQQLVDAKTESNLFKSTEVPLIQATGALLKHLEQLADGQTNPKLMYPILGFDRINM